MRSALTAHVLPIEYLFLAAFPVHGRSLRVRCGGSLDLVSLIPYQYGTASQYNLSITLKSIKSKHNTTHPNSNGRPIFHPKARYNYPSHRPRPPPHRNRLLQRRSQHPPQRPNLLRRHPSNSWASLPDPILGESPLKPTTPDSLRHILHQQHPQDSPQWLLNSSRLALQRLDSRTTRSVSQSGGDLYFA